MASRESCLDCGRQFLRSRLSLCPSCKTLRCFVCWVKHLETKVCAYGKADKIDVVF
jgi:hypothetical protein